MTAYKDICPQCHGNNLYVTPHNGKKYCFNCGYFESDGTVTTAIKRSDMLQEIRHLYTELTSYYHSCLGEDHRAYLNARGISDASIAAYKLGYIPDSSHVLYNSTVADEAGLVNSSGKPLLGGRISFPYFVSGVVTDIRARAVQKNPVKYLSPKNGTFFRGADYPFNHDVIADNETIVITEGDPKAIASMQAGIACVSLPGIVSIRPALLRYMNKRFIVCFDSQLDNRDVYRAIHRMYKFIPDLSVATLPLMGFDKMDIDGYIQVAGQESYKRVINRAVPYRVWAHLVRV